MSITKNQLESLQQALSYDHAPLCSGAISPPPEAFYLYYGKHNPEYVLVPLSFTQRSNYPFIRFVDLASATPDKIKKLSAACDPATFGRRNEDVYDESYRKATNMDASNFAVQFDPVRVGLIKIIEEELLRSQKKEMSIGAEIYKLNVYGALFDVSVFKPQADSKLFLI